MVSGRQSAIRNPTLNNAAFHDWSPSGSHQPGSHLEAPTMTDKPRTERASHYDWLAGVNDCASRPLGARVWVYFFGAPIRLCDHDTDQSLCKRDAGGVCGYRGRFSSEPTDGCASKYTSFLIRCTVVIPGGSLMKLDFRCNFPHFHLHRCKVYAPESLDMCLVKAYFVSSCF